MLGVDGHCSACLRFSFWLISAKLRPLFEEVFMKEPIVNIAVKAARAAGNLIIRAQDRLDMIKVTEKNPRDFVTDIDRLVEQEIIAIIRKAFPQHGILGEESGEIQGNDYTWIIDPIDGTRNFIHGFPQFAVSIAVRYKNRIEHGVIYDPVRQELFTASRGKGAHVNDRRMRVSKRTKLEESLLGTGFPSRQSEAHQNAYLDMLKAVIPLSGDVRRAGSAALDLAYIAAGRLDGFWEMGLKIWDMAAGVLLIREAGGLMADFNGSEDYLKSGNIIAGNPKILKQLLQLLQTYIHLD